jgi:hypothetical protein
MNFGLYPGFGRNRPMAAGQTIPEIKIFWLNQPTYILTANNVDDLVVSQYGSAVTLTLSANMPVKDGSAIHIMQYGTGQVTVTPASGVTLYTAATGKTRVQSSVISLMKIDAMKWVVFGDMAAS